MGFREAQHLDPLDDILYAEGILRRRRADPVVGGIGAGQSIPLRERMIAPGDSKVFPNRTQRVGKCQGGPCGPPADEQLAPGARHSMR